MRRTYKGIIALFLPMIFLIAQLSFAQYQTGSGPIITSNSARVSFDLKGMDVVEVLKMLASKGNMNIVMGSNVKGRVTMFLKDVFVEEAFEIILAANNLASDKRGDIIYVMTGRDYEQIYGERYDDKKKVKIVPLKYARAQDVGALLNQIKTRVGKIIVDEASNTVVVIDSPDAISRILELVKSIDKETDTRVFELSYATAEDIRDKVKEMLTKGLGTMQIDTRTNKIAITDIKENLEKMADIIEAFDTKLQQVLIEAKIIEVTLTDVYQFGIDWQLLTNTILNEAFNKDIGIKSTFSLGPAGTLNPVGEIIIGSIDFGGDAALIQILKTIGDTNILSSPRITVLNNEEAKIIIGESRPYATSSVTQGTSGTSTTAAKLEFIDVGVKLYVTPTISRDGFITMKVRPEVSSKTGDYEYSVDGSNTNKVPIVSTTNAETSVMVKDGATIIIAGLIKDDRSESVSKVPFLGDLPIIGMAFKKVTNSIIKKELVIFLTPHIISGENDYLRPPDTPPIGEMIFTTDDDPTFERRKPQELDPTFMKRKKSRIKKEFQEAEDGRSIEAKKTAREKPPRIKKKAKKTRKSRRKKNLPAKAGRDRNVLIRMSAEEYFEDIKYRIKENLLVPKRGKGIKKGDSVKVSFLLYSGGNLVYKPDILESTSELLAGAVSKAVEKASPFPRFPLSFKESKKRFTIEIAY